MSDSSDAYRRARERVKAIRGWYIHLMVYVVVNGGLIAIDLISGDGLNWAYWPLIGWGVGLLIHSGVVWLEGGPLGRSWEERKIRELLDKERQSSGDPNDSEGR